MNDAVRSELALFTSQLLEMQQNYQDLLRHNLNEQRLHFQAIVQQAALSPMIAHSPLRAGEQEQRSQEAAVASSSQQQQQQPASSSSSVRDDELVSWLENLNVSSEAIQRVR